MIVERHINRVFVEQISANIIHIGGCRNALDLANFLAHPRLAAIGGDLNKAVIRAHIEDVFINS